MFGDAQKMDCRQMYYLCLSDKGECGDERFMSINSKELLDDIIKKLNIIDASDIPNIALYMDQVTTFMDAQLKESKRYSDDKILTKTMINNYAKNDLLPPPEKKKYSKEHVLLLTFIYYFKNIMSINDIKNLLEPLGKEFYNKKKEVTLESIYTSVRQLEIDKLPEIQQEIKKLIEESKDVFENQQQDDKEFLELFVLISMLSFDVYVKKQLIEKIIDTMEADRRKTGKKKTENAEHKNKDKSTKEQLEK